MNNPYLIELPSKYPINQYSLILANEAFTGLWNERRVERNIPLIKDRSGSCKFAALLARDLFGGRIAGNTEHVFVLMKGQIIDLNKDQSDVKALGDLAYVDSIEILSHPDYIEALDSCIHRVHRWVLWFNKNYSVS